MKLKTSHILIAVAAIFILVAGYWFTQPRAKSVDILTLNEAPAERVLAVNGRIRPRMQVDVRPLIGGEIIDLPFDVGDRVAAGQVIAQIDDAPEAAAIAEADAAVQAQQAVLAQARRDLARFSALGEFVSKRDLEEKRLAVVEGERELKRRQASRQQASEQRDRRTIRAPFAGTILARPVDKGQAVGLDSIIYRLADLSAPEVRVEVDESYAAEIRAGMAARVSIPAETRDIAARVDHIEPNVDPATGARNVRLVLADAPNDAPSGLTVTVNLQIETRDRALSIPRSAILSRGGKNLVRVIGPDGRVGEKEIRFLDWPAEKVIVTAGLQPKDRILINPDQADVGDLVEPAK
jgi:HlyD family secretion protein